MTLTPDMERELESSQEELRQLIRQLCAIPAPSHHEERRAEFCLRWLRENGGTDAFMDEALNVICPCHAEEGPVAVLMAHMDTVFPDTDPLPRREENGRLYCPGVCDDTTNLAILLLCARFVLRRPERPAVGLVFVANSCEEGLGNLKGCRAICRRYGDRMAEFITLDGFTLNEIVDRAVGSHRYRVTVRTEGGHSFSAFGNRNAIHELAGLITDLYRLPLPQEGDSTTTYNVGKISGGTSVNAIAQEASMLWEYRSDSQVCLQRMQALFAAAVEDRRRTGLDITVEQLGDRPCAHSVDAARQAALLARAEAAVREGTGLEPYRRSGSTDANMPLSLGIPALCLATCNGKYWHTRNEYLEWDSILPGCRTVLAFLSQYYS